MVFILVGRAIQNMRRSYSVKSIGIDVTEGFVNEMMDKLDKGELL